jgi:hypothetical protein
MFFEHYDKTSDSGGRRSSKTGLRPNVLTRQRLKLLMDDSIRCYHEDRTHLALARRTPAGREAANKSGSENSTSGRGGFFLRKDPFVASASRYGGHVLAPNSIEVVNPARCLPHPPHGRCGGSHPFVYWRVVEAGSGCRMARAKESDCLEAHHFSISLFVSQLFSLLACAAGRSPAGVRVRLIPIHPRQPWMCMKSHPRRPLAGTSIFRPEAFSAK